MAGLTRPALRFVQQYGQRYLELQKAAILAERLVASIMKDANIAAHVTSRAKTIDSVIPKLRRKRYTNPHTQLTDAIGVRVMTYYQDDVDRAVQALVGELIINRRRSVDRRQLLDLRTFGYRSVHLIAKVDEPLRRGPEFRLLRHRWFEIQIRSVLEHAWAEIEHDVVYKAGVSYPKPILRRLAAMAGALEVLEHEFLGLREAKNRLIEYYRRRYVDRMDARRRLDVARLLGYMEAVQAGGLGWREAQRTGRPFEPGSEMVCVEALDAVGVRTAAKLEEIMKTRGFRRAIRTFSAGQGLEPGQVSHLALVVLAVAVRNARVLADHFPDILHDPNIASFVAKRVS
jgi:ppGpp synthetase/RelA/SpoT-type nucleotidyltranferase